MANGNSADADDRWTLHAFDRALLGNKAGATRLEFAMLLKMFQADGRFPQRLDEVPLAAIEAIAHQVERPCHSLAQLRLAQPNGDVSPGANS